MRRLFTIILSLSCVFTLMACGAKADDEETTKTAVSVESAGKTGTVNEDVPISGGWGIYEKLAPGDNKEAVEALKKAEKDLEGYNYEVISVLGSQVVAGMNYLYLCKGKAAVPDSKPEYLIVKVYENLEGKAEITETESVLAGKEGEWVYNEGSAGLIENSDAENAFNKALENVEGADYEPVAYIGNAGRKYAILSKITTAAPNPQKSISVIYITVTDNGAMIDDIKDILTVNISN